MDNIYHILNCDICGEEVREKYIGPPESTYGFPSPNQFEYKSYGVIMTGDELKKWTVCKRCGDALIGAIADVSDKLKKMEDPIYADFCDG